ncbi:hypothetical protein EHM69_07915 [candidate division KSB1 bacterium]|nr:MAG: hypothetical protein EHM69_07915 [candidate division KSB1 bacterium]
MIKSSFVNHMDQLFPDVPHAVSFSEALPETISQLVYHPSYQNYGYEPYGIMVHKESAFSQNGGPVWYINNEIFKALTNDLRTTCPPRSISQELLFLLSPYAPYWSSIRSHRNTPMDWTQEREWRCPEDFALPFINGRPDFFVIVKTDQDMRDILALGLCGLSNTDFLTIRNSPNCSLPLIPDIF